MMQPVPLDVLPYAEFGRMRLGSFVPPGTELVEQSYVEWMDGLWLHEGIGFTGFGRLMAESDQTAGLGEQHCGERQHMGVTHALRG
jgi:hypothetical protein